MQAPAPSGLLKLLKEHLVHVLPSAMQAMHVLLIQFTHKLFYSKKPSLQSHLFPTVSITLNNSGLQLVQTTLVPVHSLHLTSHGTHGPVAGTTSYTKPGKHTHLKAAFINLFSVKLHSIQLVGEFAQLTQLASHFSHFLDTVL